jgi:hypothetical protein
MAESRAGRRLSAVVQRIELLRLSRGPAPAPLGSCALRQLRSSAVALFGSCALRQPRSSAAALFGSRALRQLRPSAAAPFGSCVVRHSRCLARARFGRRAFGMSRYFAIPSNRSATRHVNPATTCAPSSTSSFRSHRMGASADTIITVRHSESITHASGTPEMR